MKAKKIVYTAIMIAFGVLLPQVFHMIGGPGLGGTLLPMHIPVLLSGFILGPVSALIVGLVTPMFSFVYTGGTMPAIPMLYFMIIELGVYGLIVSLLYNKYKSIFISLVGSLIIGRAVRGIVYIFAIKILGISLPAAFGIVTSFVQGIPGIIIQIIIIPPIIAIMRKKGWIAINDDRRIKEVNFRK